MSYSKETKLFGHTDNFPKNEMFTTDWTGMDCMAMSMEVIEHVDLRKYDQSKYGLGEDGWFCIEAKECGIPTYIDPTVTTIHIDRGDKIASPPWEAVKRNYIEDSCPHCGKIYQIVKKFLDIQIRCTKCRGFFYVDVPWRKTKILREATKEELGQVYA